MQDYHIIGVIINDVAIVHLALYAYCDPISFESAAEEKKWNEAMDAEISAIEKK